MEINSIAIVGAGAVGTFYGAKLQESGYKVQYLTSQAEKYNSNPLTVKSIWGDFQIQTQAFSQPTQMSPADLVIIATKALPHVDYGTLLPPLVHKDSILLLLQNGINQEEKLQSFFPHNSVLGGLAFTCIHRLPDMTIEHLDYGLIKIGPHKAQYGLLAKHIADIFKKSDIQVQYHMNLKKLRWEKLLWNIPFNSLSVIAHGADTSQLISSDATLDIVYRLMRETLYIADAEGVPIDPATMDTMVENTQKMTPYKTSMLLDFENKRPMEIEAILGEPIKLALRHKLNADTMYTVYQLLKYYDQKNLSG